MNLFQERSGQQRGTISLTLPESDLLGEGWTAVKAGWTSTLAGSRW